MQILVTGAAGFIGFHLSRRLVAEGHSVIGIDNVNDYYDVSLKESRIDILNTLGEKFTFVKCDISNNEDLVSVFRKNDFSHVVHLAAQAGVRYSMKNPHAYTQSNLVGFMNILECCRNNEIKHLVYASSSSVYGSNKTMPYSEHHNVDHPISLYAATKKANELLAHSYSHLYGIPVTGLRFFTVYGPWGRPDMAYFSFTKAISEEKEIELYNFGEMERDFTYIDDIVEGIVRLLPVIPTRNTASDSVENDPAKSSAPYRIFNIGNNSPVKLLRFVEVIESLVGKKAKVRLSPMQPGDVLSTYADIDDLTKATGYSPKTPIEKGLEQFVKWFRDYYGV